MISQDFVSDLIRRINILEVRLDNLDQPETPGWVNWTPTVDQGGSVTVTVDNARVFYDNGKVDLICDVTVTGSGTAANAIQVSGLPYNIEHTAGRVAMGNYIIVAGGTNYVGTVDNFGANLLRFMSDQAGFVGTNPSVALSSGNTITFTAKYEAA